ncbi:type II toxin-antitoxin system PemK/MazF family toxin [Subtercola sp. RTI3]|uniref:type II toxin-antitoxin system PemK/MazF family toxin n=1 Tax=Subtercola sp. RTI3 TaxID=3048639 RepID=UPI002B231416|nr:type II toxin-antitoxin system PemK/MazF family toxin [Subtercola sp. RTI3]MEA9985451.1 type II toxin-antitoxin system PemK/MazF family toxin [Subtercola sp. RTI3]
MVIRRGSVWWVDLGEARGSAPAKRRPVVVVQADEFSASAIATVTVAVVTSNTQIAEYPGNVFVPAAASGLPKDSAVNVSQLVTLDKGDLVEQTADLPLYVLRDVDRGLRLILAL